MRILVLNTFRRVLGGAESYLRGALPALVGRGHEVAFAYEIDAPAARPLVFEGEELAGGPDRSLLRRVRDWRPDVTYLHGSVDLETVERLRTLAPLVFFAHDYSGGCISGLKTWQSVPRPCARPLGPACLLHYYPHRCGGRDPRTMWRSWTVQRRRQAALRRHDAVVVASSHMRDEMLRQGVARERVHVTPIYAAGVERVLAAAAGPPASRTLGAVARLLFVGRLDRLKGVDMLLAALPGVADRLRRPVRLTVAGDGPEFDRLERKAPLQLDHRIAVDFAGWCDRARLSALMRDAELLVVPSVWPEPFGLVGPEAGVFGLPAAAFRVGGIPAWLSDGQNGRLAAGDRPSPGALAVAIASCLSDPEQWQRMRHRAWELAARFRLAPHLDALEPILASAVGGGR